MAYLKLKEISVFTLGDFVRKAYTRWNEAERKFERSDSWQQGFQPRWTFKVNADDQLDFTQDQLSQMLVACFDGRRAMKGTTFGVKTNGKTGQDIRYYLNLARDPRGTMPEPAPQPQAYPPQSYPPLAETTDEEWYMSGGSY